MKTLGRILIILIAALAVIGTTYALSQTTAFSALVGQPIGEGGENGNRPTPPDFANGQGGSWETVVRNFLIMGVIIGAVPGVWAIGRRIKRSATRNNQVQWSRSS